MQHWAKTPMLSFANRQNHWSRRATEVLCSPLLLAERLARRCGFARFARNQRGETMLEFAFVAPMLILLMLTIVDLGIMLTSQSVLNGATQNAARLIRTGQIEATSVSCQGASTSIGQFQCALCTQMASVMSYSSCTSQVLFEVNSYNSCTGTCPTGSGFGAVSFSACTQNANSTGNGTACNFTPGSGTQIVGVRVVYNRSFIVPWVGQCLTLGACWFGTGTRASSGTPTAVPLTSTAVFQNEPFPSS